jgi:hypothetical protein
MADPVQDDRRDRLHPLDPLGPGLEVEGERETVAGSPGDRKGLGRPDGLQG